MYRQRVRFLPTPTREMRQGRHARRTLLRMPQEEYHVGQFACFWSSSRRLTCARGAPPQVHRHLRKKQAENRPRRQADHASQVRPRFSQRVLFTRTDLSTTRRKLYGANAALELEGSPLEQYDDGLGESFLPTPVEQQTFSVPASPARLPTLNQLTPDVGDRECPEKVVRGTWHSTELRVPPSRSRSKLLHGLSSSMSTCGRDVFYAGVAGGRAERLELDARTRVPRPRHPGTSKQLGSFPRRLALT